ncbi:beta-ketoacyl synthase N-terminal-like domain-containing protein [Anaerobaca lacustris]|uniref:Beta-ketoacyl synthase N-terminal-like domain-containing protein n=1 Tax=Anaerobaca lacustris TaxID=3044600 RepID=A0AAW6TSR5_9BACT|nr:beta-ketoacyl synthase N-terminal-like domain-containing protein [Sedimentisphaerales bacterium M17dextr]
MKLEIAGAGWVTPAGIGHSRGGAAFAPGSGALPRLRSTLFLDAAHPRYGRFDLYAKAGFGAIAMALRGAGLERWECKRPIGLVVGTQRGCLDNDVAYFRTAATDGGALASPNLFAYTLPTSMLGEASIQFGLTGPSFVVDNTHVGRMDGIHAALDLLRLGLCSTIVAGWCDVHSEIFSGDPGEPCGAVFAVLSRGGERAAWQWQEKRLVHDCTPIDTIERLVAVVLERTAADGRNKNDEDTGVDR